MVMQLTQSLVYTRLLAKGVARINLNFRQYAKLDDDTLFEAMMELASEMIDESNINLDHYIRTDDEKERDEMEYELHMNLQADLTSYLVNEIRDIVLLKKNMVWNLLVT
jgi:hypothetical protein